MRRPGALLVSHQSHRGSADASTPKSETVATIASGAVASAAKGTASVASARQGLPPPSPATVITTDPSDLIFDYAERIAICCEAGDVPAEEAERIATAQCGASLDELIALQVNYWRQRKMRRVH